MITRLRWQSTRTGTFGHEAMWQLFAGQTEIARVEPDYGTGAVLACGTQYQHHTSVDEAKRAAEALVGAVQDDAAARLRKLAGEMLEVESSLDDRLGAEALRNAADMLEAGP